MSLGMFDAVPFRPIDLEFLAAARALQRDHGFLRQGRASTAVGTDAVGSPKMGRCFPVFRRPVHYAPALRRPLLDFEPGTEHTDLAVIDVDNCLKIRKFEDPVPRTAAQLEGDISLQTGK